MMRMNSKKSIIFLVVVTASIVVFWLAPGINKARDTTYTRLYEDTDRRVPLDYADDTTKLKGDGPKKANMDEPKEVVYKSESIQPNKKEFKVRAEMFSRAVHFVPVYSPGDSVNIVRKVEEVEDSVLVREEAPL
jgi:hypothetical protein